MPILKMDSPLAQRIARTIPRKAVMTPSIFNGGVPLWKAAQTLRGRWKEAAGQTSKQKAEAMSLKAQVNQDKA